MTDFGQGKTFRIPIKAGKTILMRTPGAGPFWTRGRAEREVRNLTKAMDNGMSPLSWDLPLWVKGFRVKRTGRWQYRIEATAWRPM